MRFRFRKNPLIRCVNVGIWEELAKYGVFDVDYPDPNYHYW